MPTHDPQEPPAPRAPARRALRDPSSIALAAVVGAVALAAYALVSRAGYVPLWDGRIYADCVVSAALGPWSLDALRCANHPSYGYVGVLVAVQRLAPGSFPLMLLANAGLLVLAWAAFARLLRRLLPDRETALDRRWLLAAFVVHPVVLSSVVQINLDFGVLVYLLAATAAALERRRLAMAAFGLLACFSKESGVVLYALLVVTWWVVLLVDDETRPDLVRGLVAACLVACAPVAAAPLDPRTPILGLVLGGATFLLVAFRGGRAVPPLRVWRQWAADLWLPLAPVLLFAADLFRPRGGTSAGGPVLWKGYGLLDVLGELMWPQFSYLARGFLALTFLLQFHWLLTLAIAAAAVVHLRQRASSAPRPAPVARVDRRAAVVVCVLLVGMAYLLSRSLLGAIPRYVLPTYPLLLAAFALALLRLRLGARARSAAYAAVCGLFALSAFHTVDPLSRRLWGTFDAGELQMLRLNSIPRSCCGHGRDQSIYNLQFTGFSTLEQQILDWVRAHGGGVQVRDEDAVGYSAGPVDARGRRSLAPRATTTPPVVSAAAFAGAPVGPAWYVGVPYVDNAGEVAALRRASALGAPDTVRAGPLAAVVWPIATGGPAR